MPPDKVMSSVLIVPSPNNVAVNSNTKDQGLYRHIPEQYHETSLVLQESGPTSVTIVILGNRIKANLNAAKQGLHSADLQSVSVVRFLFQPKPTQVPWE